jgi:hypothetical protein
MTKALFIGHRNLSPYGSSCLKLVVVRHKYKLTTATLKVIKSIGMCETIISFISGRTWECPKVDYGHGEILGQLNI